MKKIRIFVVSTILIMPAVLLTVMDNSQAATSSTSKAYLAGRNVNMVSGTRLPWGDPWLQRQNEPSLAVSSRNPMHILGGANDYRTIDMPENYKIPGISPQAAARDAWVGLFKSFDGGQSWITTLLPGFPQDGSQEGLASPIHGFDAACDPCVRGGANGLFFYSGIAFNRDQKAGAVFVARFIDNNNLENIKKVKINDWQWVPGDDPLNYIDTHVVDTGNQTAFLDMPSLAVDIPRSTNTGTSTILGQTLQNASVYIAYTVFSGTSETNAQSKIVFSRSTDGGLTWSAPIKISENQLLVQRPVVAIDPHDLTGKTIYVAFRRFGRGKLPGGIVIVKSCDGGKTFTRPIEVHTLLFPFDQVMNGNRFRTNSYPTMAVDGKGIVYIAWTQRLLGPSGQARIVIKASINGLFWLPIPLPVELLSERWALLHGHQFMPTLTAAGGKLLLAWYDQRNSISSDKNAAAVEDAFPNRQTIDVRAAEGTPGLIPIFKRSQQVSRYLSVLVVDGSGNPSPNGPVQVEFNPPNYPLFQQGTTPFHGDFMDLVPSPLLLPPPVANGTWSYNVNATTPTIFHSAWTDNRDVRPPQGNWWGDWSNYHPPNSEQDSSFVQENACAGNDTAGMRNQNVYTADISNGVIVGSPGNVKQLNIASGAGGRRTFVVVIKNTISVKRTFHLVLQEIGGVDASFAQNLDQDTLDIGVIPYSSYSCTVYVDQFYNPLAPVRVDIRENGVLMAYVLLNPDGTNPPVTNPEDPGFENGNETHNPRVWNPRVWNYALGDANEPNPKVLNSGAGNPQLLNPQLLNTRLLKDRVINPAVINENYVNVEAENPRVWNAGVENTALTDVTWTVSNEGNTTSAYSFDIISTVDQYFTGPNPPLIGQVLVYRVHTTPVAHECDLYEVHDDELIVNVTNPRVWNPRVWNGPPMENSTKGVSAAAPAEIPKEITFYLAPGEEAYITFRVWDPVTNDGSPRFDAQQVTAYVESEPINTGEMAPSFSYPPDIPWVSPLPRIGLTPASLTFNAHVGQNPPNQTLTVRNSGGGTLSYSMTTDAPWLSVTPPGGGPLSPAGSASHQISADISRLTPGTFSGTIIVNGPNAANNPARVAVTLIISATPPGPTKVQLSGPTSAGAGFFSDALTLTAQDAAGNPANVAQDTVFNLSSDSDGPNNFYAGASDKLRITQAKIPAGTSSAIFYFKDAALASNRTVTAIWVSGGPDLGSASNILEVWPVVQQIVFERGSIGPPDTRQIYAMNADGTGVIPLTSGPLANFNPCLSPNGGRITFVREQTGGNRDIYVMNADGSHPTFLAATNPSTGGLPVWSPDETKIAFVRDLDIWVMDADGKNPVNLTNSTYWDCYPSWSPDGSKIFFSSDRTGTNQGFVINTDGSGGLTQVTADPMLCMWGSWSPNGAKIVFSGGAGTNLDIFTMNPDGSGLTQLTANSGNYYNPQWSPDGSRIIFMKPVNVNHSDIYIMNMDGTGQTRLTNGTFEDAKPYWGGGKIVFDSISEVWGIWLMNPNSSGLTRLTVDGSSPSWSPDGTKIAFVRSGDIYVMNSDGTSPVNITKNGKGNDEPCWSPDSSQIAFVSSRADGYPYPQIYKMDATGDNVVQLTHDDSDDISPDWSPDGTKIAFCSVGPDGVWADIYVMDADGNNPTNLTNTQGYNYDPCWSPDGSRIAFASDVYGTGLDICIMNADGSSEFWTQLTSDPGDDRAPGWSSDGREIAFQSNRTLGHSELYVIKADGSVKSPTRLTDMGSDTRNPSWRTRANLIQQGY